MSPLLERLDWRLTDGSEVVFVGDDRRLSSMLWLLEGGTVSQISLNSSCFSLGSHMIDNNCRSLSQVLLHKIQLIFITRKHFSFSFKYYRVTSVM